MNTLWHVERADCLEWLATLPDDSVDLCLFSPPYEAARTYSIGFNLRGQDWVDWMVKVFQACLRVCKGLVACVCEGQTRQFRWTATPALLMADLHRAGFRLRKPLAFHRVGIPGSGGPDWFRNDYEFIVCATKGKLPWSDNTACGHTPKWAPGGEMSHRLGDGRRRNQWGGASKSPHERNADGVRQASERPSHVVTSNRELKARRLERGNTKGSCKGRRVTSGHKDGDTPNGDSYDPPVKANPGNVLHCKVGGGLMGHALAHENEAPYPLKLAEFFVLSCCPPGGIVCDPFSGSGTTLHAALANGRRFMGCDVRQSQVELTKRRAESVTPAMF